MLSIQIKNGVVHLKIISLFLLLLTASASNIYAELIWPLDIEIEQSASFAESRGLRLHAGIDLRTRRQTGFPIRAIDDGYISRVSVQFRGYGYAVYLNHPQRDFMVVYAHLRNFADPLGTYIQDKLDKKGARHGINDFFGPDRFPVKKGQIIGWSGDTGSGPPHLHFEMRTLDNVPVAPAKFGYRPPDNIFPRMHNLYIEPMSYASVINNSFLPQTIKTERINRESYRFSAIPVVIGEIALKVGVSDWSAVGNVFGVEKINLIVNNEKLIERLFHRFSYAESRQAPWVYDYFKTSIRTTGYVYNLFKWPFETIGFASNYPAWSGIISVSPDKKQTHDIVINAIDYGHNAVRLTGQIQSANTESEKTIDQGIIKHFSFDKVKQTTHSLISIGHAKNTYRLKHGTIICTDHAGQKHEIPCIINGNRIELAFPHKKVWQQGAWIDNQRVLPESVFITPSGGNVAMEQGANAVFNNNSVHFPIFATVRQVNINPPSGGTTNSPLPPLSSIWKLSPDNRVFDQDVQLMIKPESHTEVPVKLGIYRVSDSGRYSHAGGSFKDGFLSLNTRTGGRFVILKDLIPPTLKYARTKNHFHLGRVWAFSVSDIGKGVNYLSARATVNGNDTEVYSDPDKREIYVVQPSGQGRRRVLLHVDDYAQNTGTIDVTF